MSGKKNGHPDSTRTTRTYHVVPITRAIRAALAISVTMLALSGSGAALAGSCTSDATANTESCNGAFTNLPDGSFVPVADLTVVLGDSAPTSVSPAAGTVGVDASWGGNVGVISHADITTAGADGVHEYGSTSATLNSYGSITTNVTVAGANAMDISAYGDVTVVNGGDILAYSAGSYAVTAVTAYSSHGNVSVANLDSGTISAKSTGGGAVAVNASAHLGSVDVTNSGSISATAGNYASATGVNVGAGDAASVTNSGSIYAAAGNYGTATGIHSVGVNSTTVTNSGDITSKGPSAYGINAYASGGLASVANTIDGDITLTGNNLTGIRAGGYHGTSYVNNAGDVNLTATGGKYTSTTVVGIKASTVNNSGNITAVSDGPLGSAKGIQAHSYGSNPVSVTNSGNISLSAAGIMADETGISATNYNGGSIKVVNSGDISVAATSLGSKYHFASYARGISVDAIGDAYVLNSGIINASAVTGTALGIKVFGEGASRITNSGSIIVAGPTSIGIAATSAVNGSLTVVNSGSIAASGDSVFGIQTGFGSNTAGNLAVTNSGDIALSTDFEGHGVNAYGSTGTGSVTFDNSGTIAVSTNVVANEGYTPNTIGGAAYGVNTVNFSGNSSITNSGSITAALYSYSTWANGLERYQTGATGLLAYSHSGDIGINNSGTISASSEVRSKYFGTTATGIRVTNDFGNVALANAGTVSATALSDYRSYGGQTLANGILVNDFRGDATINNSSTGSITANSSTLHYGTASAIGIDAYTLVGSIAVTNAGAIRANAQSGATSDFGYSGQTAVYGATTATGVRVTNILGTTATVTNSSTGAITANAVAEHYGAASATGINAFVYYGDANVSNAGAIAATAQADNHSDTGDAATAIGVSVINSSPVDGATTTVSNSGGAISANASAYLSATAQGMAVTGSHVDVTSASAISATATADAVHGTALATGVFAYGSNLAVSLGAGSNINATATGNDGTAIGLSLAGNTVLASNAGTILAQFNGAHGNTYGAIIASNGDTTFTNSGHITATDADHAVGVVLDSATSTTLVNSGSITASSTAAGSIAVLSGDSTDSIQNTGTITGALVTHGGNDTLTNSAGGVWNVIGASTDFGSGDDTITNAGTINLHDSSIALGSSDAGGNSFSNSSLISAFGNNSIDMGANNPNPFTNTGNVELRNGKTGDALTLTGDWAGSGKIGLDVDPLHGGSDKLHIIGNVAAGSVTAVNVDLLDLPTTAKSTVPVVDVKGDSTAGSFVLGDVHFDTAKSFLVVQGVNLTSVIDNSNATPDVFSLGVVVTGLTDSGALAASIVPGVESLMNSEVGTWRQRMGVLTPTAKGSVGLWTRAFQDSGAVNPGHIANNFGQEGNFSFNQTNSGEEIGADFALSENLSVGLMLGKAQANQHLDGNGVGRNRISGDTRGAYLTWMTGGGFYLDGSFRTMSFDTRLDSQTGESRTTGDADAFNVEIGQSWAFGDGFKLVPQLQYTHTTVNKADTLSGALAGFTPRGGSSSRGRAGVTISKDIAGSNNAVWTPYASVSAVHEFDGQNDFTINDTFNGTTNTKGTSALVEGGLSVKTGKLEVFGGVNWQDGGALKSIAGGQVGLRVNW